MKQFFRREAGEFRALLRSVPPLILSLFLISVFGMNLLANKSIDLNLDWLALDCGITLSWLSFLCMDVLTKHFGPKAASELSALAIAINLFACLVFFLSSMIPGTWGAFYDYGELDAINLALDGTFGGTWYVLLGSTVAFLSSALINNFCNFGIGVLLKNAKPNFLVYALRTYLSTALGQFADNLIFALLVSHFFFGWSLLQCFTCAATGMLAELLLEVVFSPLGYRICNRWSANGVGAEYFDLIKQKKEVTQ